MKDVAITLDTANGSVPILGDGSLQKSIGVTAYLCVVDPLATPSLFSGSLSEKDDGTTSKGGGQATL